MEGARGVTWTDEEVGLLVSLWADDDVQLKLRNGISNKEIFVDIASRMAVAGFSRRDAICCQKKIQTLKRTYREWKDTASRSGSSGEPDLPRSIAQHFDAIDSVLSDSPLTAPELLTSAHGPDLNESSSSGTSNSGSGVFCPVAS